MVISDHLNLLGRIRYGPNDDRFGPRFPDLTSVYAPELQNIVIEEARRWGWNAARNYGGANGPSSKRRPSSHGAYAGADAVGMSTVPEASSRAIWKRASRWHFVYHDLPPASRVVPSIQPR